MLGRADVGSFDVTFDDRSLMRTVKTRYQLPGSGEVKSVELKNPKAPATAMGEHVDRHLYTSRGEAEQAAKARLASFSRSSASVRLELPGVATCSPSAACCSKASRRESTASS